MSESSTRVIIDGRPPKAFCCMPARPRRARSGNRALAIPLREISTRWAFWPRCPARGNTGRGGHPVARADGTQRCRPICYRVPPRSAGGEGGRFHARPQTAGEGGFLLDDPRSSWNHTSSGFAPGVAPAEPPATVRRSFFKSRSCASVRFRVLRPHRELRNPAHQLLVPKVRSCIRHETRLIFAAGQRGAQRNHPVRRRVRTLLAVPTAPAQLLLIRSTASGRPSRVAVERPSSPSAIESG